MVFSLQFVFLVSRGHSMAHSAVFHDKDPWGYTEFTQITVPSQNL